MINVQHRKKLPSHRNNHHNPHHNNHNHNHHNNNSNNSNHHHHHHNYHNNHNNNRQQTQNSYQPPKKQILSIANITDYAKGIIYGSLDYPIPTYCPKNNEPHKFNELPTFKERPVAKLTSTILGSTYRETLQGPETEVRKQNDLQDPAVKITTYKRANAKTFKLGDNEIDITTKYNIINNSNNNPNGNNKLVNKFLQNDSLTGHTTPLKRIRDEVVDASSSVKKNKRLQELQQDTTMELSFEGKAMDKNDYVKLVDSSGIMADDSHIPDTHSESLQNNNYDTKNLLQNTEFSFEYKK